MRSLRDNLNGMLDLTVILMVGIAFAGLMVVAYLIWILYDQFLDSGISHEGMRTLNNTTGGFDDAVNLLLVAITIFILAIAISALLMLRGR